MTGLSPQRSLWWLKSVPGYLNALDAEIFRTLLARQTQAGTRGAVAEIGVHHGRSFIPLALALQPGEKAWCIDLFDDQSGNLDRSGHGNRNSFESNLKRSGIDVRQVVIEQGSSLDLRAQDITAKVGPVRFFSVDGGHWKEIVENDLRIAAACLDESGVIALDDFLDKNWPDVTLGFHTWFERDGGDLVPFAISTGKLYLCRDRMKTAYKQALINNPKVSARVRKHYDFCGQDVLIITGDKVTRARNFVRRAAPALEAPLRRLFAR